MNDAITFRAWDTTNGTAGTKVSAAVNGGTTAFSAATDTAAITVTAVNDAPTVAGLVVTETSISFTPSDVDNATLSLAAPFAAAFGNPTLTSGVLASLTPTQQAAVVSGILQVTDGSSTANVVNLYLGTSGGITYAAGGSAANAIYGFGGNDVLTGGTGADSIFGGANDDTINLANGDFVAGEVIDGGANKDSIVLTSGGKVDFTTGTVTNVETLTGSSGSTQ